MKELGLFVFGRNETQSVIEGLGLTVDPKGSLRTSIGNVVCQCCGHRLKLTNFGAALPGSRLYYCDEPACLVDYVSAKLVKK